MNRLFTVVFATLTFLTTGTLAQTPPVQTGNGDPFASGVHVTGVWGIKIYSNRLLDITPREFGLCTADPDLPLVYCGAGDGTFRALRKHDGQAVWRLKTSGAARTAPAVSDNGVFLASADGCVHRLNRETGESLWKEPYCTGQAIWGSPVVTEELLYFSVLGNQVYAVDIETGRFKFKVTRDKPRMMSSEGISAPVVSGNTLFSAFSDGVLVASDRFDGKELWVQDLAGDDKGALDADASPVVDGDIVYSASFSGGPVALRTVDGTILWKARRFGTDKPVVFRNFLIAADANGYVTAFDKKTGTTVWSTKIDSPAAWNPVLVGNYLLVSGDRGIWILRPNDGRALVLKKMPFGQTAEPAVDGNDIYFTGPGGTINRATLTR